MLEHPAYDQPHYRLMARVYKTIPPVSELWQLFELDPLKGLLYRKNPRNEYQTLASRSSGNGYRRVRIGPDSHKAHRLIWAWVHGKNPDNYDIDHVKGKEVGDMPWNLRLATPAQNAANQKSRGWDYDSRCNKYQARIRHNYRCISLGMYDTPEEAYAAYERAAVDLRKEFCGV